MYHKYKPMPHEKVERNRELYQLRLENPKNTYAKLGELFGISRQRAHKIVQRQNLWQKNKEVILG